jgi:hypothetical protein
MRRIASFAAGLLLIALTPAAAGEMAHYPTASNPWTKRDYLDFYFAHFNGNQALPHLRSPEQRRLFARIVDDANLRAILASSATPEDKGRHLAMILGTVGEIRAAYAYAVLVGEPLREELAQVQIFMLDIISAMSKLPYADDDGQRRQSWQTMVFGIVTALSERQIYSKDETIRLSQALAVTYPAISRLLDGSAKRQFATKLTSLAMTEDDQDIRREFDRLIHVVAQ